MSKFTTDTTDVVSVWSAYGHHFIGEGEGYESCLRCGAMYQLLALADDRTRGAYTTICGGEPAQCTGDTSMVHGYSGERHCDECEGEGCEHCEHHCPCVRCDS